MKIRKIFLKPPSRLFRKVGVGRYHPSLGSSPFLFEKWWLTSTDFQGSRDINRFPPGNPYPIPFRWEIRTVVDPPRGIVGEISVAQEFPPGPPSKNDAGGHPFPGIPTWSNGTVDGSEIPFPTTWDGK